jgi:hypothetical protein
LIRRSRANRVRAQAAGRDPVPAHNNN